MSSSKRTTPSTTTKPRVTTELEKLKAELKTQVGRLKGNLGIVGKDITNEKYAKVYAEKVYGSLIGCCDDILAGEKFGSSTLALFRAPFADVFHPDEVLSQQLDQSMYPCRSVGSADEFSAVSVVAHKATIESITEQLANGAGLIETILARLNSPTREEDGD
jgi:ATP phosphoribosyltransferase